MLAGRSSTTELHPQPRVSQFELRGLRVAVAACHWAGSPRDSVAPRHSRRCCLNSNTCQAGLHRAAQVSGSPHIFGPRSFWGALHPSPRHSLQLQKKVSWGPVMLEPRPLPHEGKGFGQGGRWRVPLTVSLCGGMDTQPGRAGGRGLEGGCGPTQGEREPSDSWSPREAAWRPAPVRVSGQVGPPLPVP